MSNPQTLRVSDYDRFRMGDILTGKLDHFDAHLFRLIYKATGDHYARLKECFPDHVAAYEDWRDGGRS